MSRLTLGQLERRCQKPDYRTVGNWMARRVSRPAALRITWLIAPWGVSAHACTLAATLAAVVAAAAWAWGTVGSWLIAATLLQLWYLLDHVDGQLARLHGTASLDGVQLDYLMHHLVRLLVPLGVGYGLGPDTIWLGLGLAWALGLLLLGLLDDTRYKAFIARLKTFEGELRVEGGGKNSGAVPITSRWLVAWPAWFVRKNCEIHVVMNVLSALAVGQWFFGDERLLAGRCYLAVIGPLASIMALAATVRSLNRGSAEREFSEWYRPLRILPEEIDHFLGDERRPAASKPCSRLPRE